MSMESIGFEVYTFYQLISDQDKILFTNDVISGVPAEKSLGKIRKKYFKDIRKFYLDEKTRRMNLSLMILKKSEEKSEKIKVFYLTLDNEKSNSIHYYISTDRISDIKNIYRKASEDGILLIRNKSKEKDLYKRKQDLNFLDQKHIRCYEGNPHNTSYICYN